MVELKATNKVLPDKDYTQLTLEALLAEQKKMKQKQTLSAVIIGFLVGIIVYGLVTKGFHLLFLLIPVVLIGAIVRDTKNLPQQLRDIAAAIRQKRTQ